MRINLDHTQGIAIDVPSEILGRLVGEASDHHVASFLQGFIPYLVERQGLNKIKDRVRLLGEGHLNALYDFVEDLVSRDKEPKEGYNT